MNDTITWKAQEHRHVERGSDWYWALGTIAVSSALTAILFNNILFAMLIILAAVTMGAIASRPPQIAAFSLGERGLLVNESFYPYEEMFAFWVSEGDEPALLIDTPRFMNPDLVIPLHDVDADVVRDFMRERVPEVELRVSPFFKILEFFGF